MTRVVAAVVVAAAMLAGLILIPPATADRVRMDKRSADVTWQANRWYTVGEIRVRGGSPVSVGVQLPLRRIDDGTAPPSGVEVVMVRMPRRDGTGNLSAAWPTGWPGMHVTHWHTVAGFRGTMLVRAKVVDADGGTVRVPYRIVKARQ